jgi:hypothetical protein
VELVAEQLKVLVKQVAVAQAVIKQAQLLYPFKTIQSLLAVVAVAVLVEALGVQMAETHRLLVLPQQVVVVAVVVVAVALLEMRIAEVLAVAVARTLEEVLVALEQLGKVIVALVLEVILVVAAVERAVVAVLALAVQELQVVLLGHR